MEDKLYVAGSPAGLFGLAMQEWFINTVGTGTTATRNTDR